MCEGNCFKTFAKVLLIIVNIFFCLAGLLMLAFGIALVVAPQKVISFLSTTVSFTEVSDGSGGFFVEIIKASGIFMIILGGIVTIIAVFGFFGACCENNCMLVTYAIILIIIVLAEVALIIFAAVYPTVFEKVGEQAFNETLMKEYRKDMTVYSNGTLNNDEATAVETTWNAFQVKFNCCGSANYSDYGSFNWEQINCEDPKHANCPAKSIVPLTCCKLKVGGQTPQTLDDFIDPKSCMETAAETSTNREGCSKKVINAAKDYIMSYSKIAIGIAAGIVGLEIILITLAFIMCCCRDESRSSKYV
jgi:hypothetical protein